MLHLLHICFNFKLNFKFVLPTIDCYYSLCYQVGIWDPWMVGVGWCTTTRRSTPTSTSHLQLSETTFSSSTGSTFMEVSLWFSFKFCTKYFLSKKTYELTSIICTVIVFFMFYIHSDYIGSP